MFKGKLKSIVRKMVKYDRLLFIEKGIGEDIRLKSRKSSTLRYK